MLVAVVTLRARTFTGEPHVAGVQELLLGARHGALVGEGVVGVCALVAGPVVLGSVPVGADSVDLHETTRRSRSPWTAGGGGSTLLVFLLARAAAAARVGLVDLRVDDTSQVREGGLALLEISHIGGSDESSLVLIKLFTETPAFLGDASLVQMRFASVEKRRVGKKNPVCKIRTELTGCPISTVTGKYVLRLKIPVNQKKLPQNIEAPVPRNCTRFPLIQVEERVVELVNAGHIIIILIRDHSRVSMHIMNKRHTAKFGRWLVSVDD